MNKWFRKIHRWIAVPTGLLIPVAIVFKLLGDNHLTFPKQIESIQSILMLGLAITGIYLFLLPHFTKWSRNRRRKKGVPRRREATG
ncbi:MAG: hypothetical protein J5I90_21720 [Caldilineales bacterium]|nr:hypothetical protein [Caldilineales bacterium]